MKVSSALGIPPYLAGCISGTSYITLTMLTRTFSNSIETFFLSVLLVAVTAHVQLVNNTKTIILTPDGKQQNNKCKSSNSYLDDNTTTRNPLGDRNIDATTGKPAGDSTVNATCEGESSGGRGDKQGNSANLTAATQGIRTCAVFIVKICV